MRIISGKLKCRRLKTPKNYDIRPTSDRVKEAIFSILASYITDKSVVVDLFSGTGNLGLEAISRGAKTVFFSDSSKESIALTKENITTCGVMDQAVLLLGDYRQNIRRIHEKVDIFLLDPPYLQGLLIQSINIISESNIIAEDCIILCEHSSKEILPDLIGNFALLKTRKYGSIQVSLYHISQTNNERG